MQCGVRVCARVHACIRMCKQMHSHTHTHIVCMYKWQWSVSHGFNCRFSTEYMVLDTNINWLHVNSSTLYSRDTEQMDHSHDNTILSNLCYAWEIAEHVSLSCACRPIAGYVNLCPSLAEETDIDNVVLTVIHELTHALVCVHVCVRMHVGI